MKAIDRCSSFAHESGALGAGISPGRQTIQCDREGSYVPGVKVTRIIPMRVRNDEALQTFRGSTLPSVAAVTRMP